MNSRIEIIGLIGMPEFQLGDDLAFNLHAAILNMGGLVKNDILVVTQKIISKVEGRTVNLNDITPDLLSEEIASKTSKDARLVQLILNESREIIRVDYERGILITETNQGFICANAGIDSSNVPGDDNVTLLPIDSDKSANKLLSDISDLSGESDFAVIITDTFGRAWREGHVNFAIGSAGIALFIDYKDSIDTVGKQLKVTNIAVADEIAAASELVTGKLDNIPAVIVRGYNYDKSPSQRIDYLLRSPDNDLFR